MASLLADLAWDITGRKRAEEVLRVSELKFKTIFNESPFGIALIDSLTGQVYSANPMFEKIAGRKIEDEGCFNWMGITHPDDIQKDLDNMVLLNAGLILCKDFIEKHGGELTVESNVGKGSIFSFTMPSRSNKPTNN